MEPLLSNGKIKFTPEGGLAVLMVNGTGAPTVKGDVVHPSETVSGQVILVLQNEPDAIGIIYESGIPNGQPVWVVVSGIADVNFINATTTGNIARTFVTGDAGYVTGKAIAEAMPAPPFSSDKHFCEIGHVIQTTGGAGLAKVVLHFN